MGMRYVAEIVQDQELPEDVDRVIVERPDGPPLVIIKASAAVPEVQWYEARASA